MKPRGADPEAGRVESDDGEGTGHVGSGVSPAVLWAAWTILIVAVTTIPWHDVTLHPHWEKVVWVPFRSRPVEAWELVANLLLFVPFGYLGRRWFAGRRSVAGCRLEGAGRWLGFGLPVAAGAALSVAAELAQVFIHGRFPSSSDVLANLAGSAVGVVVAAVSRRSGDGSAAPSARR